MPMLLKTSTSTSTSTSNMVAQPPAAASATQQQLKNPMFHDFLGVKPPASAPVDARPAESSPAASLSAGASSGGGRGGPISTTSDLGSERQVSNHYELEGVPFYGPRSDVSGPEINNRIARNKRSSSDSAFMGSARDAIAQIGPEGHENIHLMKMLRNGPGGERQRRSNEDEVFIGSQQMRQASASLTLHPGTSNRNDPSISKWDRSAPTNMGPALQFPPRGGQFMPSMQQHHHHPPPNRYRDVHATAPMISQPAADEGSRTGMKGPGILNSINAPSGIERSSPVGLQTGGKPKSGMANPDPESSNPLSRHGQAPSSKQMTIFYGGQAHVFDDVHPNKADIIMALAGSNGGSWSTIFSPKSGPGPSTEANPVVVGENETDQSRERRGKLPVIGSSSQGFQSTERIAKNTGGGLQSSSHGGKEGRNPNQAVGGLHSSSLGGKDGRNPNQAVERDNKRDL